MVLFGTQETSNAPADRNQGHCSNVSTVRTLKKIDLDFFRDIETFTPEEEPVAGGSMIDALEVSMDMLERFCGKRKYRKRLFMITDGEKNCGKVPVSRISDLVNVMKDNDIRLNVITLDFANELGQEDSDEESEIEEEKPAKKKPLNAHETATQTKNKEFLIELVSKIKGAIFPASVAIEVCKQFKKREVMPRSKFRGNFDLAKDLQLGV